VLIPEVIIWQVFFLNRWKSCFSFRRTCQRTCPFSKRCQGRPENTRSYLGMSANLFLLSLNMSSNAQRVSRFWAGQSTFFDRHRTPPPSELLCRRYEIISCQYNENLNSSTQVVVQRVSSFQLNYTTFSTQISPDIIRHSLNSRRLPSTMSHPISLGLLINHWESIT
jgi:hypothetical protein